MRIFSIRHKGLRRLIERNDARGLPPQHVERITVRIAAIVNARDIDDWLSQPLGRPHALKGDRKGDYAVSVSANMRITFTYDGEAIAALDLDFEDYH